MFLLIIHYRYYDAQLTHTLAGWGSGMSTSRTGSQLECAVFCSLCGPSKLATMLSSLNAHTAEPRRLFLYTFGQQ